MWRKCELRVSHFFNFFKTNCRYVRLSLQKTRFGSGTLYIIMLHSMIIVWYEKTLCTCHWTRIMEGLWQIHLPHLRIHKYFTDDSFVNFPDKFFFILGKIWQKMKKNLVMEIYGWVICKVLTYDLCKHLILQDQTKKDLFYTSQISLIIGAIDSHFSESDLLTKMSRLFSMIMIQKTWFTETCFPLQYTVG